MKWRLSIGLVAFVVLALYFQLGALRHARLNLERATPYSMLANQVRLLKEESSHPEYYQPGQRYRYVEDDGVERPVRQAAINYALSPAIVDAKIQTGRVLVYHTNHADAKDYARRNGLILLDKLDDHLRLYEERKE